MVGVDGLDGGSRSVIVVGAGIVGLSTAWFLHDRGVEVAVVDRTGVAAGASWGKRSNAWVGARPVTPDGRLLIGEVSSGVYGRWTRHVGIGDGR